MSADHSMPLLQRRRRGGAASLRLAVTLSGVLFAGSALAAGGGSIIYFGEPAPVAKPAPVKLTPPKPVVGAENIHVVEMPLADFLKQAGRRFGVKINTSFQVRGTLRNADLPSDLDSLLDQLAQDFDLNWTRQNGEIEVTTKDETVGHVISLGTMSYDSFLSSLTEAGIDSGELSLNHISSSNMVSLKGPAPLIAQVELIAEAKLKRQGGVRVIREGKEGT